MVNLKKGPGVVSLACNPSNTEVSEVKESQFEASLGKVSVRPYLQNKLKN
jgi:hypothetical protein